MSHKKFMIGILLLSSFSYSALASSSSQTSQITIKFDAPNPDLITQVSLGKYEMSCKGKNNGYYVSGSMPDDGYTKLQIGVTGPFDGDDRETCKILTNNVYFILEDIKINYTYDGKQRTCSINQGIGTSWQWNYDQHNKLQGETPSIDISCSSNNKDTYYVQPGHYAVYYDKGNITITIQK